MHDRTKWYINSFVDWLSAKNTCRANLICDFTCLVEDKGKNVLVVRDGDDRLQDEFSRPDNRSSSSTVVSEFV